MGARARYLQPVVGPGPGVVRDLQVEGGADPLSSLPGAAPRWPERGQAAVSPKVLGRASFPFDIYFPGVDRRLRQASGWQAVHTAELVAESVERRNPTKKYAAL